MFGRVLITLLILHRFELTKMILYTPWKVSKYGRISGPYFPLFRLNTEITGQKKLRIWTRFTQWYLHRLIFSRFFYICGNLGNVKTLWWRLTWREFQITISSSDQKEPQIIGYLLPPHYMVHITQKLYISNYKSFKSLKEVSLYLKVTNAARIILCWHCWVKCKHSLKTTILRDQNCKRSLTTYCEFLSCHIRTLEWICTL